MGEMGGSIVSLLPVARGGGMGSDLKNGLLPPLVGRRRIRARRSSFCLRACFRTRSFSSSGSITGGAGVDGAGFITAGATTGGLPTGERAATPALGSRGGGGAGARGLTGAGTLGGVAAGADDVAGAGLAGEDEPPPRSPLNRSSRCLARSAAAPPLLPALSPRLPSSREPIYPQYCYRGSAWA
jgi:hypothetical protein